MSSTWRYPPSRPPWRKTLHGSATSVGRSGGGGYSRTKRASREPRAKTNGARSQAVHIYPSSVLGSWGNAMRDAVRNRERGKGAVRLPKILVLLRRELKVLWTYHALGVQPVPYVCPRRGCAAQEVRSPRPTGALRGEARGAVQRAQVGRCCKARDAQSQARARCRAVWGPGSAQRRPSPCRRRRRRRRRRAERAVAESRHRESRRTQRAPARRRNTVTGGASRLAALHPTATQAARRKARGRPDAPCARAPRNTPATA